MKNRSISKRLTLQIMMLMISFSLILLLANSLLLRPLYYHSVKSNMLQGMETLETFDYLSEDDGWIEEIAGIDPGHNYDITIVQDGSIIYSSSMDFGIRGPVEFNRGIINEPDELTMGDARNPDERPDIKDRNDLKLFPKDQVVDWQDLEDGVRLGTFTDPARDSNLYVMTLTLDHGLEIYLTQGLEPILDSVNQANVLLMVVTAVFLLVAVIAAFKMSQNFTRPIRSMQLHVGRLSRLEFEENLHVKTGDELQELSSDINQLSDELQRALAKLQEQNKQLERDIKSQRKFISNASHELRTPLALIKGYADEIVQGFVKDRNQEHLYVGYIAEESAKMKRLLNEILELSRFESGRMELHPTEANIRGCIEGFIDKYAGFIEDHQLEVEMDLEDGVGYFDTVRFEQVLANFISNAGKYSNTDKKVIISSRKTEDACRITVKNSGNPIPQEVMDYIWDGFYKADEARTGNDGSYGLGLSIVKAIQEMTGQAYGCYNEDGYVAFWFEVEGCTSTAYDKYLITR